jgi:hypothetical protein
MNNVSCVRLFCSAVTFHTQSGIRCYHDEGLEEGSPEAVVTLKGEQQIHLGDCIGLQARSKGFAAMSSVGLAHE